MLKLLSYCYPLISEDRRNGLFGWVCRFAPLETVQYLLDYGVSDAELLDSLKTSDIDYQRGNRDDRW